MSGIKIKWLDCVPHLQDCGWAQGDAIRDRPLEDIGRLTRWAGVRRVRGLSACQLLFRISKPTLLHTGTVTIVSAMNSLLPQCKTKLPGKCPPVLIAVTPGTICLVVPLGPSMNSTRLSELRGFRHSQSSSSLEMRTGQSKTLAHSA